jgi:hypothetical protein
MITFNRKSSHTRLARLGVVVAGASGALVIGLAMTTFSAGPFAPPAVYAACLPPNQTCPGDATKTAMVEVFHATTGGSPSPVEPNTGETWRIVAYWGPDSGGGGSCIDHTEIGYATVDWNGSGWTVSNTTLTTNIVGIDVCDTSSCTRESDPGPVPQRSYKLKVNLNDPVTGGGFHLRQVVFTTTAVDDGNVLNTSTCETGASVSPTSQAFGTTDTGAFECSYVCGSITGPTVTITYN